VKAVENSLQHTKMLYASELAFAYPELDTNEVMRLSGGHWRLGGVEQRWYRAGLGCGGYCIPTSGKYVQLGSITPNKLSIIKATLAANANIARRFVIAYRHSKRIAILGLSYKEDIKVAVLSSAIPIAREFLSFGTRVFIMDPYFSAEEIKKYTSEEVVSIRDLQDLRSCDLIVVLAPHTQFHDLDFETIKKSIIEAIIVDDTGCWERYREEFKQANITYRRVGDKGWLG
jgi:UDP-N-acetyl-D-mannosaminuronate dehydrogenase